MPSLTEIPCLYLIGALIVSAYQAYRGYKLQSLLGVGGKWKSVDRTWLLCIADMFTYLLCALSGSYALFVFYRVVNPPSEATKVLEHPAILIFLLVYGIMGITGKLPDTPNKLKLPSSE
jgi:hypothetical protein